MKVPRTIRETVAAKQLFEQLLKEVPVKQSAFTPMLELFVLRTEIIPPTDTSLRSPTGSWSFQDNLWLRI